MKQGSLFEAPEHQAPDHVNHQALATLSRARVGFTQKSRTLERHEAALVRALGWLLVASTLASMADRLRVALSTE